MFRLGELDPFTVEEWGPLCGPRTLADRIRPIASPVDYSRRVGKRHPATTSMACSFYDPRVSPLPVRCSNLVDHEGALRAFQLREVNGNPRLVLVKTCSVGSIDDPPAKLGRK